MFQATIEGMSNPFSKISQWIREHFSPISWNEKLNQPRPDPDENEHFQEYESPHKALIKSKNRRKHERLDLHFKVTVMNDVKSFKTTSSDISLGGMRLSHPLPPSMQGVVCKVIIEDQSPHDCIVFHCKVLTDAEVPRRISFSQTDQDAKQRLNEWLKAHLAQKASSQKPRK